MHVENYCGRRKLLTEKKTFTEREGGRERVKQRQVEMKWKQKFRVTNCKQPAEENVCRRERKSEKERERERGRE